MKQIYKNRLEKLAKFIEENPKLYKQEEPYNCVVGLGCRLDMRSNKLGDRSALHNGVIYDSGRMVFAARYGLGWVTTEDIWCGDCYACSVCGRKFEMVKYDTRIF